MPRGAGERKPAARRAMTTRIYYRPRRRRGFLVLTPLVDVVFLLLVFFMLSSQITPYSLLVLGGVGNEGRASDAPPEASAPAVAPLVVRVANGDVTLGGRRVAIADVAQAARELGQRGIGSFVLIPTAAATVQD